MINYDKFFEDETSVKPKVGDTIDGNKIVSISPPAEWTQIDNVKPFDIGAVEVAFNNEAVLVLVNEAKQLEVIETDADAQKGITIAMEVRGMISDISEARKTITDPHVAFQKKCIALEKEIVANLLDSEGNLLTMVDQYKKERKKRLEAHDIVDDSHAALEVPGGTARPKTYYEHKVIDFDKIPKEYLKLDTTKINADIKDGVREIPGLDIFKVEKTQYRMRRKK